MAKKFLLLSLVLTIYPIAAHRLLTRLLPQDTFDAEHVPVSHIQTYNFKEPAPLQDLQTNTEERIARTFIGTVPHDIQNIVHYFTQNQTSAKPLTQYDAIILRGEPGTGKNFLIETIAQELQIPYLYTDCTAFMSSYHGITSFNIKKFFQLARDANHPVLIFIDYADILLMDEKYVTSLMRDETSAAPEHCKARQTLCEEIRTISQKPNVFVFITAFDESSISPEVGKQLFLKKITIENIKKKEDYIAFFKKSLRDNGFTSESEIEKLAPAIAQKLTERSTSESMRALSHIVPLALTRQRADRYFNKKEMQDFMFYVSEIINEE